MVTVSGNIKSRNGMNVVAEFLVGKVLYTFFGELNPAVHPFKCPNATLTYNNISDLATEKVAFKGRVVGTSIGEDSNTQPLPLFQNLGEQSVLRNMESGENNSPSQIWKNPCEGIPRHPHRCDRQKPVILNAEDPIIVVRVTLNAEDGPTIKGTFNIVGPFLDLQSTFSGSGCWDFNPPMLIEKSPPQPHTASGTIEFKEGKTFVAEFYIEELRHSLAGSINPTLQKIVPTGATLNYTDKSDLSTTRPFHGNIMRDTSGGSGGDIAKGVLYLTLTNGPTIKVTFTMPELRLVEGPMSGNGTWTNNWVGRIYPDI